MTDKEIKRKEKWCIDFARSVIYHLRLIRNSEWCEDFVDELMGNEKRLRPVRMIPSPTERASKVRTKESDLATFLGKFRHLRIPEGAKLDVDGCWDGFGGRVNFVVDFGEKGNAPVEGIPYDETCIEAIWEREMICWASNHLCLLWHANYLQSAILTGGFERMRADVRGLEFVEMFWSEIDALDDETKNRIKAMDFSPKIEIVDGKPRIQYHTFSPFGGIYKYVTPTEKDRPEPVVPFSCHVCY